MSSSLSIERFSVLAFTLLWIGLPWSKALCSVSLGLLAVLSVIHLIQSKTSIWRSFPILALTGLFGLFLFGWIRTESHSEALSFMIKQLPLLGIPLIAIALDSFLRPKMSRFFKAFLMSCAVAAGFTLIAAMLPGSTVYTLSQIIPGLNEFDPEVNQMAFGFYSPFIDRLHFSYLLALSVLCGIWLEVNRLSRLEYRVGLIFCLLGLILLGARGAQLSFILAVPIFIIIGCQDQTFYPSWLHQIGARIALLLITYIAIPFILYSTVPSIQERYNQLFWELSLIQDGTYREWDYEHFTTLRRILSIKHHITLIKESPLFGTGIGDYRDALQSAYNADREVGLHLSANAHNQYLFYWASCGLIALLAFFAVIVFWFTHTLRKPGTAADNGLLFAICLFFTVLLLFDVFIIYQIGSMSFVLFAIALYWIRKPIE